MSKLLPNTKDLSMGALVEVALPNRAPGYLEALCEKLLGEGIVAPSDLLLTSKSAMETKLSSHPSFNFREMADTIALRDYIDPNPKEAEPARPASNIGRQARRSPERRQRSRSNPGWRGRNRSWSDGNPGRRENSRPHRRGGGPNRPQRHESGPPPPKPELWAAVERGELLTVQHLLDNGGDPMEKHQGWTPLMKAAEEGHVDIIQLLLSRGVDIEATNRKGRTALSFAAAPSKRDTERRETPTAAIRLLLQSGADPKHKCQRHMTPKDYAADAKREESLKIFEEFKL